jgi:hypothetical protein
MSTYANFPIYVLQSSQCPLVHAGSTGTRYLGPSWGAKVLVLLDNTQINGHYGVDFDYYRHRPGLCLKYPRMYEGDIVRECRRLSTDHEDLQL